MSTIHSAEDDKVFLASEALWKIKFSIWNIELFPFGKSKFFLTFGILILQRQDMQKIAHRFAHEIIFWAHGARQLLWIFLCINMTQMPRLAIVLLESPEDGRKNIKNLFKNHFGVFCVGLEITSVILPMR